MSRRSDSLHFPVYTSSNSTMPYSAVLRSDLEHFGVILDGALGQLDGDSSASR